MTTNTVLLILPIVIAGGLSFFNNIIIKPKQIKIEFVFGFIAFSIVVWDLLLLINPIITEIH
jgi:hypothetical protein